MSPYLISIVEDQTIFRELLAEVLEADSRFKIVAQYSEGKVAFEDCKKVRPDLVILDVVLPDISGLDLLKQLLQWQPTLPVIMVTAHARPKLVHDAIQGGARGFVTKSSPLGELRTAVNTVLLGGRYFCPTSGPLLADALVEPRQKESLTLRQKEVVRLVAQGKSSKEIAHELNISTKTVSNHRFQIREKLGLGDIASWTRYAIEQRLIEPKA